MMKLSLLLVTPSLAFHAAVYHRRVSVRLQDHISFNPMEGYQSVDIKRAKQCAEHFGECTVEEMEVLRNNLHKERLQNFMFGGSGMTAPSEDALEHLVLEEELDIQLALLKEATPDPSLFPDDAIHDLPHLKDTMTESGRLSQINNLVHNAEVEMAREEAMLGESALETLAMCAAVTILCVAPQMLLN